MGIVGLGRIREGLCRVLKSIHCIIVCMYTGKNQCKMLTRALHFSTLPTGGVRMRHLGEKDRLIEVETKMNRF